MAKIHELSKEYTLNRNGYIQNPGKFEGEHVSTLYWYELSLDGGDCEFTVEAQDLIELAEFNDRVLVGSRVNLFEDDQGFVSIETVLEPDPTPYCHTCGAMRRKDCDCGPIAENE